MAYYSCAFASLRAFQYRKGFLYCRFKPSFRVEFDLEHGDFKNHVLALIVF
jgi:hypothetical protein